MLGQSPDAPDRRPAPGRPRGADCRLDLDHHLVLSFRAFVGDVQLSSWDGLTGAYNKRYFMDRLDSEIKFSLRHKVNLALMLLDLDKFKDVNDTYGHLAGDNVLAMFAKAMHKSIRNEDVLARYGGEEFAIITRSISRADVHRFAERLCRETSELVVESEGVRIPISVSIGVATVPEDRANSPEELIKRADDMLYEAKRLGRNRVVISEPEAD